MIFGMDTYTFVHVVLSLIGIAAGIIVFLGFIGDAPLPGLTALFLSTTVLTRHGTFPSPLPPFSSPL